jgi:hypothetical protein
LSLKLLKRWIEDGPGRCGERPEAYTGELRSALGRIARVLVPGLSVLGCRQRYRKCDLPHSGSDDRGSLWAADDYRAAQASERLALRGLQPRKVYFRNIMERLAKIHRAGSMLLLPKAQAGIHSGHPRMDALACRT